MTEVQCCCGAIQLHLTGKPVAQFFCHCDDCQAVHGAAYVAIWMLRVGAVRVVRGTPALWALKTTVRRTCNLCGTRLFAEPRALPFCGVSAALLPKGAFVPAFHIQCQFAVRPIVDDLPHYRSLPPAFGGSNERMPW